MKEHFYRISAGLSDFVVALASSWPLLVAVLIFLYRAQFRRLLTAITAKVEESTSVKMPGFEFTQTKETVDSMAQDMLEVKQQISKSRPLSTSPEPAAMRDLKAETLEALIDEYNRKTNISNYAERMRRKTSIQTRMEALARETPPDVARLLRSNDEGSFLAAISAAVTLPPPERLNVLLAVGNRTKHQFIRNALLLHFLNAVSDCSDRPLDLITAARDLANKYERDPDIRPDDTFRRNLVYYKQILSRFLPSPSKEAAYAGPPGGW